MGIGNCPPKPVNHKTFTVNGQTVEVPFKANELIYSEPLSPTPTQLTLINNTRSYLASKGFFIKESCNCAANLKHYVKDGEEVDLIGVTDGARTTTGNGVGGSVELNFILPMDSSLVTERRLDTLAQVSLSVNKVKVAIIDSGVDSLNSTTRPTFAQFLWHNRPINPMPCSYPSEGVLGMNIADTRYPEPYDHHGHGTNVNGILVNVPRDGEPPFAGMSLEVMNVKITDDTTKSATLYHAVCGMYYAVNKGAKVLNLSWGYLDTVQPKIAAAFFDFSKTKNVVVLAGAGNNGINLDTSAAKFWPACFSKTYDFVVSVGAYESTSTGAERAVFSNFGNASVDVYAPGVGVQSLSMGSPFTAICQGTSMATPYAARTAAILRGRCPIKTAADIKACIVSNAKPTGSVRPINRKLSLINPLTACNPRPH